MAKNKKGVSNGPARHGVKVQEDKAPTLKDLLGADVLSKLRQQADELKTAAEQERQAKLAKAEDERKREQKRLENDMSYLLDNSKQNWREFK
ncbi:YqkE family protein [Paenibacillus sp. NPDC058071]|uniref:YqkE family protein n=1 Tax=Paenibacillus sp. NPDC058071 TaxID=3346326 RepID=UPI0036DF814E